MMDYRYLHEFLAVAQAGSFTKAARALGVSTPHVSRAIKSLEEQIGIELFSRTTRSVQLTPAGSALQSEFRLAFDRIEEALDQARSQSSRIAGRIRVASVTGSFADQVVAPALAEFSMTHPAIELDVDFDPHPVDIIRQGYDLAIRAGTVESKSLTAVQLVKRQRAAGASPSYLARCGEPLRPTDLSEHECIRTFSNFWTFTQDGRNRDVEVHGRFQANSGSAIRAACERGVGIAYMAKAGFGDAFDTRAVIPILQDYWKEQSPVSVVVPKQSHIPMRVRALMDHLIAASLA